MKLLTVDTIEEARGKLLECAWRLARLDAPIEEALGLVLAQDVISSENIPGFRRSAVDGYAVIAADTAGAGESQPALLRYKGEAQMGRPATMRLKSGECAYVPTGAMIPEGADAMAMVEQAEAFGDEIAIYESAASGAHLAREDEDLRAGEVALTRGARLRSQEIGALAAAGIVRAQVYAPLRVTIISSGDELVPPEAKPGPGQVRDVNALALAALATESGYVVVGRQAVKDDEAALEAAVRAAMPKSDLVALSGGSSQGAKDLTAQTFSRVASPGVFTHGLAVKPGKPTVLGYDEQSATILAGLPGHPVSALMIFRILFSWLLRQLTGQPEPRAIPAKISCNLAGAPGRACYQPVTLSGGADGGYIAQPIFGKSGMISTLTKADGYIVIDRNKEGLEKNDATQVYLF